MFGHASLYSWWTVLSLATRIAVLALAVGVGGHWGGAIFIATVAGAVSDRSARWAENDGAAYYERSAIASWLDGLADADQDAAHPERAAAEREAAEAIRSGADLDLDSEMPF